MKNISIKALFLVLLIVISIPMHGAIPASEREALIALYNSTNGDSWTKNIGWKTPPLDADGFAMAGTEGTWFGITIAANHVLRIDLGIDDGIGYNLNGSIPIEIDNLSSLQYLDLSHNLLLGSIPSQIGNLTSLKWIDLEYNQLSGVIPEEIGNLTILQYLSFCKNNLSGAIPTEIGNLTNLQTLFLQWNQLNGAIPTTIGNLTNLQDLELQANQLTDTIPAQLGSLTNLQVLSLSGNQLTGAIPNELGNLTNLLYLLLFNNQLSGAIPPEIGNLTNLQYLECSSNKLSGSIPVELSNLVNLHVLDFHWNQLTDAIPTEIGNLKNLQRILLQGNQISGSIPIEIGNLTNLNLLDFSDNQLSGEIPLEIGYLPNIWYICLNSNQLTGTIPPEIGNLTTLNTLWLHSNQLTGTIPVEICNLTNLTQLYLSDNQLTGVIPSQIGNLTSLLHLYLADNQFSGSIPEEIGNLNKLMRLLLSSNKFTGSIPSWIGSLTKLSWIFLNDNYFTGTIPPTIGNLLVLRELRLQNNKFSGTIPNEIGNLTYLNVFMLSNNKFIGSIPIGIANMNLLWNLNLDYNGLYTSDTELISFLNLKNPNWASTQTIAPTNIAATPMNATTINLTWDAIAYTGDTGGYQVHVSTVSGGPFSYYGQTLTKSNSSMLVSGLTPNTIFYFIVSSRTDPHGVQQNTIDSEYSLEATAITQPESLIIITPNGGESWTAGSSQNITWSSTGTIANVNIDYSTNSGGSWIPVVAGTANDGSHAWTVPSTPSTTCLVRVSDASNATTLDISDAVFTILAIETVSAPSQPTGADSGLKTTSYPFTTGSSLSSLGHTVQYKIDWDDGTDSGWLDEGTTGDSHSWVANGTYDVKAMARCATHSTIESLWSTTHAIIISDSGTLGKYNSPSQQKILPEVIWASATGGGTWVSEVQITDISGGSQVSVYYSTSAGRQGPFPLWSNGGGALRSQKYANILQTIDGLDSGVFTYYGTVGAMEFVTQDAAHMLQVMARTLNGSYSKTFPAFSLHDSNTADTSRVMIIPNLTNNSTYRSTVGMYNPTADTVTVELKLKDAVNTQVGTTITKTIDGYGFSAFLPFNEAGRSYPAYSYDNVILSVQPISGTGKVLCFGASANNVTNDPASHIAVQNGSGNDNGPSRLQILPEAIWAAATGGGTWMSETQINDVSGGSIVSVYFDYGGGNRRGPFVLWTGSGAGSKVKYANILQQIGTIDSGFTYYGRVGTVEFQTQDSSHFIQMTARTLNGNYSKTFPGLNLLDAETADTSRVMIIQNYASNSTYRSTCGFFNPTGDSVTVEFTLLNSSGVQIGTQFNKTFVGYDFQAFLPFTEAGVPYPANSFDNVVLRVRPTSGSGQVICFGASANNASNDPASHLAVQGQ